MDLNPEQRHETLTPSGSGGDDGEDDMAKAGSSGANLAQTLDEAIARLENISIQLRRVQDEHGPYDQLALILGELEQAKRQVGLGVYGMRLVLDRDYMAGVESDLAAITNGRSDDELPIGEFAKRCRELSDH